MRNRKGSGWREIGWSREFVLEDGKSIWNMNALKESWREEQRSGFRAIELYGEERVRNN